jgi:IS5 family transposase
MDMTQMTFGLDPLPKKTRKEVFLDEMNLVVPWGELVALIQPHARGAHQALGGRPPFAIETMLRIHCLQLWWNLSDPAMEEELHERPLYRRFAGLQGAACPTRAPSCAFGICWRSTNSPRRSWP